jgi:geranylgeranyl reductase family protein
MTGRSRDVLIVGAGPAGAVLAYLLARRGLDVLVLEKASLPRYKTCGGGVTLKTLQNLPFDASPVYECQAIGGILSYAGQQLLKADLGWTVAWTVMRGRFDHFLIQQAVVAGAQLIEGVSVQGVELLEDRVVVHTGQGEYSARLLAGADGVNSTVARSSGMLPDRRVGVAVEAEVEVAAGGMSAQGAYATFDFGALPHGYGWIFPKQDHLSVGVFQARPGKAADLRQRLEAFIACQPALQGGKVLHLQGHPIPLGASRKPVHRGRALLVGDAANLADPWLGEGIYYAVLSARLAADVMAAALGRDDSDLREYTRQVHAQIISQQRYAALFAGIVYRIPRQCSLLLSRSPLMQDLVFSVIRGDRTFRQMSAKMGRSLPRILLEAL